MIRLAKPLEEVGLVGLDPEVMELDLGLRPGQGRRRSKGGRVTILVGQIQNVLSATRATTVEKITWAVAPGSQLDPAPQAEDRIQHRADRVRRVDAHR